MPMQVVWDDDAKTILRTDIIAPITWEEFDTEIEIMNQFAASIPYPIDLIINPGSTPMPLVGSPIPHIKRAFRLRPDNVRVVVCVASNTFARVITAAIGEIHIGARSRVFESLDDARECIQKARAQAAVKPDTMA